MHGTGARVNANGAQNGRASEGSESAAAKSVVRRLPVETESAASWRWTMTKPDPFKGFHSSLNIMRLGVMPYVRFPLSLRKVEDLLHERGVDVSHETVRFWWQRFGPMFASEIHKKRADLLRSWPQWRWHSDEMLMKINGEHHYLWRAPDKGLGSLIEQVGFQSRLGRSAMQIEVNTNKSMTYGPEKVRRQTHPLRHLPLRKRSPDPAAAGFFRCFRGLCGWGC